MKRSADILTQPPLIDSPPQSKPAIPVPPIGAGTAKLPPRASIPWAPDQAELLPARVRDVLGTGHLAFFYLSLRDVLDFGMIEANEKGPTGRRGFNPVMMTLLLMYAYSQRVHSSREIERRCATDLGFRFLSGGARPDHDTICDFRVRHLTAFAHLFKETVRIARAAGAIRLGHLAIDGSKFQANASKHKAMSYDHMAPAIDKLDAQIDQLLEEVQAIDAEETRLHGTSRGDELPPELCDPEQRDARLLEAKRRLDQQDEAKRKLELVAEKRQRVSRIEDAQAVLESKARSKAAAAGKPPEAASVEEKAQHNFTDPDSRIMPKRGGEFVQAYNPQIGVDAGSQIIVAQIVTQNCNDKNQLSPVMEEAIANTGSVYPQLSADSGYLSEPDVASVEALGTEVLVAPGRQKHGEVISEVPERSTEKMSMVERMRHKLTTKRGRKAYALRKVTVEPVFGQMKEAEGFRRFSLRGIEKVRGEFSLACAVHNVVKLWRLVGPEGLRPLARGTA